MPLVKLIGALSANMEKPWMGRTTDSMIFLRSRYDRLVNGRESRRRISKNTSARCRVPPSEASDLKEHCELGRKLISRAARPGWPPEPGTHITGVSSGTLRTLCLGPTAVLSMRLRILQNSEGMFNTARDETKIRFTIDPFGYIRKGHHFSLEYHIAHYARHPLSRRRMDNRTRETQSIQYDSSFRQCQQTFLRVTSSLMDRISVVCRIPFALAKNPKFDGSLLRVDLDMDLGAFAVVLGFSPNKSRVREKL